jgi:anti-sigma regulatory factor (Ser/Thr protein kinase)
MGLDRMPDMPDRISIRSDRAELPRLLAWVRERIAARGLERRRAMILELAAEELGLNAMTHGRTADREGSIECSIDVIDDRGSLRLVIEDDGPPFDPTILEPPDVGAPLEAREVGGLGLHLIRSMAMLRHERVDERNRVEVLIAPEAP